MTFTRALGAYFVTLPIFFAIDMLWLGTLAKAFYQRHLGYLLSPQVNWTPAILFYLVFIAGIVFFAVKPALETHSPMRALVNGAVLGFVAYATYDLTNHATVRDWPLIVTLVDLAWGTTLCGSVAWLSYVVSSRIGL
jgi:uncharacterized membrane protein